MTTQMRTNQLDQEAAEITKTLESFTRFSPEWENYITSVIIPWTTENNRPLYYTYSED